MGRLVVGADVGLDLDDPADPWPVALLLDELRAEQPPGGRERRPGEDRPGRCAIERQANRRSGAVIEKVSTTSRGNRKPRTASTLGMMWSRR